MAIKLLLVENDASFQRSAEAFFSGEGFEVVGYGDGLSALDMFSAADPDVILAEHKLAGMNILRFCEKIKQKSGSKKRYVFLLVQPGEQVDQERLRSLGVVDFISKPPNLLAIANKMKSSAGGLAPGPAQATAGVPPVAEDSAEGQKMEELLGWAATGKKVAAAEPAAPPIQEDDRTVVIQPQDLPPQAAAAEPLVEEPVPLPPAPDLSADKATAAKLPESMSVSASKAGLAQEPARPTEPLSPPAEATASPNPESIEASVSTVAREIIEKVAWEVVPTIAEALIKQELEKIKSGQSK